MDPGQDPLLGKPSSDHVLCLVDHLASFLEQTDVQGFLDALVGCTDLGNDEIHKDNACHHANYQKHDPVEYVVTLTQVLGGVKIKVTD